MTHHTSGGVQLSVRYAAEVAAAAAVVFGAVSDWPKGVQEHLQRVKGWTDHQFLSVEAKMDDTKQDSQLVVWVHVYAASLALG